jgi:hypothetical protein
MPSCQVDFTADASDFKRAGDGLLKVWVRRIISDSNVNAPAWWAEPKEVGTYIKSVDIPNVTWKKFMLPISTGGKNTMFKISFHMIQITSSVKQI